MPDQILKQKDVSPAKFFLTYIAFGMISLLIIIAASVYFRNQKNDVTMLLAVSILVSNFLAVWGYAAAIMRRPDLLSDPEAPDLAYYLGFSLTVGALSFSFLADLGALQAANPQQQATLRSGLVSGSLAQFGAGLLATLIGLSFKIYLTSQQHRTSNDPTEMYNQFRTEVGSFSAMLKDLSNDLTGAINQASSEIQRSGQLAGQSMTEMSETLQRASEAIAVNITHERISAPVDRFIAELESISLPLKTANEVIVDFNKQTKDANLSIKSAATEYLAASQVVRQSATSIDVFSSSVNKLNPDLEELNLKLGEFLSVCNSGTSSLKILTENTNLTATEILNNARKLQELTPAVGDSIDKLKALSNDILQVSQNARLLSGCVLELVQGASTANQVSGEFANTLSETAQHTQNLILKLDDMSDACMEGLNSLQDFQQATNTSAFTANNFAQSLQASGDIVTTATSNLTLLADSISSANTEVATYTHEVNAGTQEFRQSISNFVTGANGANQSIGVFSGTLDTTNRLTLSLNNQLTGLASSADGSLQALNKLESSALSTAELTGGLGSTVKVASDSIEKANVQVKNLSESVISANTEISKLSNSTNSLNVASASQAKVVDEHLAQSTKFIENYQHILKSVDRQQQLLGELDTKLNSLILNIGNLTSNGVTK
jgi:chromosome segregation ATPase